MRQSCDKTITIAELVYLLYFAVMFGARAVGLYEGMLIYNISLVAGMLLFALKVACTEHTVAEYAVMGALLLLSLLVYYNTGEKGLLLYFTMMLGMKGVALKRVEITGVAVLGISFIVLTFFTSMGWMQDSVIEQTRFFFGRVSRHALGYPHPNTLMTTHIVLMVLCFSVLGEMDKKMLSVVTVFFLWQSVYLYVFSCSNTGLIVSGTFLAANFYLQMRRNMSTVEKILIESVYPLCLVTAIVLPVVTYPFSNISERLRVISHNRWLFSQYYLMEEPITLFGTRFKPMYWGKYLYMIDSSFLYSFSQIGVIAFLVVTILYIGMIHDQTKNENRIRIAVIMSFCLLGLSDPFMFNLSYKNIMFLYIGEWMYRKIGEWSERHVPAFLGKKICLLKCGLKKITLLGQSVKLTAAYELIFEKIFIKLCLAAVAFVLTVIVMFGIGWNTHITGKVDEIHEWDYFRRVMACGHWLGIGVIFLFFGYQCIGRYRYDLRRNS